MEIVKGVYLLKVPIHDNPLGFLNCYLIAGRDGWLMIDTGWNTGEALTSIRAGLKELGLEFTDMVLGRLIIRSVLDLFFKFLDLFFNSRHLGSLLAYVDNIKLK